MNNTNDDHPAPRERLVMPLSVVCPACGEIVGTEGTVNEFAAFVGCCQCHRLVKVIYADGDVSEVLKA